MLASLLPSANSDAYFCWHSFHLYVFRIFFLTEFISVTQFAFSFTLEYFVNARRPAGQL